MIWVLFASVLWSSVSGLSEYHRIRDRQLYKEGNEHYKYHSQQWHKLGFIEKTFGLGTGIEIALDAINEKSIFVGDAGNSSAVGVTVDYMYLGYTR